MDSLLLTFLWLLVAYAEQVAVACLGGIAMTLCLVWMGGVAIVFFLFK